MKSEGYSNEEEYKGVFHNILRGLLNEKKDAEGISVGDAKKALGRTLHLSKSTIDYYAAGKSSPDFATLVNIATYFHVSTDYLLGLTEIRNTDEHVRETCDTLMLSERSFNTLTADYFRLKAGADGQNQDYMTAVVLKETYYKINTCMLDMVLSSDRIEEALDLLQTAFNVSLSPGDAVKATTYQFKDEEGKKIDAYRTYSKRAFLEMLINEAFDVITPSLVNQLLELHENSKEVKL